jgi:hypothetical protein
MDEFSPLLYAALVGLAVGLLIALILWLAGFLRRRELARENRRLKEQLHRQMEITGKGNDQVRAELESLRKANENLRITVATLKTKPGRAELATLQVYDKAIHLMFEKAPGFAPAWEGVLKTAQEEIDRTETGFKPLLRKVFRPSLTRWSNGGALTAAEEPQLRPGAKDADIDRGEGI